MVSVVVDPTSVTHFIYKARYHLRLIGPQGHPQGYIVMIYYRILTIYMTLSSSKWSMCEI